MKISIVIPTYNLENYIEQCLRTLRVQTFKDFEVIIVDDCSTDKTLEVIKNFASNFEEDQIRIYRLNKNSNNGGATPKNLGLNQAQGDYVLFLDGDDLLTATALQDFTDAAEKFQADMVFTESFGQFRDSGQMPQQSDIKVHNQLKPEMLVKTPTLDEIALIEKIRQYTSGGIIGFQWNKILRREFLLKNGIKFTLQPIRNDAVFSLECFCLAKSVRIPSINNLYRLGRIGANSSISGINETKIRRWIQDILFGASELQDFCQRFNFQQFEQIMVNWFIRDDFRLYMPNSYKVVDPNRMKQLVVEEVSKDPAKFIPVLAQIFNIANGH